MVAVLGGVIVSAITNERSHTISTAKNTIPPPALPYIEKDVSPFEGALYDTDWVATAAFQLYAAPTRGSDLVGYVRAGEKVHDETGDVNTTQYGVYVVTQSATIESIAPGMPAYIELEVGDLVYQLNYYGEGYAKFWANGRAFEYNQENLSEIARLKQPIQRQWWVRVMLQNGTRGWMENPHNKGKEAAH